MSFETPVPPRPHAEPGRIAVYGTLMRGGSAWHLLETLVTGAGINTTLPGTLYDTACGYPALRLEPGTAGTPAQVFQLRDAGTALSVLDAYEGPQYDRIAIMLDDGEPCWVYSWRGPVDHLKPLPDGWLERT